VHLIKIFRFNDFGPSFGPFMILILKFVRTTPVIPYTTNAKGVQKQTQLGSSFYVSSLITISHSWLKLLSGNNFSILSNSDLGPSGVQMQSQQGSSYVLAIYQVWLQYYNPNSNYCQETIYCFSNRYLSLNPEGPIAIPTEVFIYTV
jgi:hypothetical protein